MAYIKATYVDDRMVTINNSYWSIKNFNCDLINSRFEWMVYGYASKAAMDAGAAIIGHKRYALIGDYFLAAYYEHLVTHKTILALMWEGVMEVKDTPDPNFPDDVTKYKSYFEDDTWEDDPLPPTPPDADTNPIYQP